MLIHNDLYSWEGFGGKLRLGSGICRLKIYDLGKRSSAGLSHIRPIIVMVTDVEESPMSVRSCIGHIATRVTQDFDIEPNRMMFIEHYPERIYGEKNDRVIPEKFDMVEFEWHSGKAIEPVWRSIKEPMLENLKDLISDE